MSESIKQQPSCADDFDADALLIGQARERILENISPVAGVERLAIREALGRVLAEDVISGINVPGHTNSAMDGYALNGASLAGKTVATFTVIGTAMAGTAFEKSCGPEECVRIMTGAPMPAGTDTVIMQEHVEKDGDTVIKIDCTQHRPGQNVRQAGEDIAKGGVVLAAGRVLVPSDLGVLASLGIGEVMVRRRPRVAFFSTGDELRSLGEPLRDGDVYDSNRYSLYGMLTRLNAEVLDMGVVADDPQALREAFTTAAEMADVVITSGGVSVGEADYTKTILDEVGQVGFWKIAIKPGRPLAFGHIGNTLFFGLPGNPVAVMVTFYQLVQPALERLAGRQDTAPFTVQAITLEPIRKRPGRHEFQRGILSHDEEGRLVVKKAGMQGSGILTTMSRANCFILLDEQQGSLDAGEWVTVQPFNALI